MSNVSKKALKERNFRKREKDRKRFEKPLRVFLEHKYKTIYEEYEQLFNLMVTNHPNKRNLVSTKTFKNWLQANPKASDILSVAVAETLGEIDEQPGVANEQLAMNDEANEQLDVANEQLAMNDEANEQLDVANEQLAMSDEANGGANPKASDILSVVVAETLREIDEQPDVANEQLDVTSEELDIAALDRQIDRIVDELLQEEELRAVMEMGGDDDDDDDDEGIEISVWDELALDIEPFDYELEVEGADW